ncbi:MAG: hypothetical protein IH940_10000 [Acidobacteria bacterium]|nr:hypothetical protein [Acidobacteriota bacterium]
MTDTAYPRLARGSVLLAAAAAAGCTAPRRTALDDYVHAPDPAYAWNVVKTLPGEGHTTYVLELTSQTWLATAASSGAGFR